MPMFTVDKLSRIPIYEQLIRQFEVRILSGDIPANGLLPSVRSLFVHAFPSVSGIVCPDLQTMRGGK